MSGEKQARPTAVRMSATRRIVFLLPAMVGVPVGGFKVVYEYANHLVRDGYAVGIVYRFWRFPRSGGWWRRISVGLRALLRAFYHCRRGWHQRCPWFDLDPRILSRTAWSLAESRVPPADIYVATDATTAGGLNAYKRLPPQNKFYLIQGFETWVMGEAQLRETYGFPLRKIAVSNWLKMKIEQGGHSAVLIPNGFDFSCFRRTIPAHERDPACMAMTLHSSPNKGSDIGFKALALVKKKIPQIKVLLYGTGPAPQSLPDGYHYFRRPNQEQLNHIYNEAAIFLGTSFQEGWGLPIGEAMICGAAVVCTDNGGYAEMAKDYQTALVVPVGDPEAMAEKIVELILDKDLRLRLAEAGHDFIQQFTWERSCRLLEQELMSTQIVAE